MTNRNKPKPKSQKEIANSLIQPYEEAGLGKQSIEPDLIRGNKISVKNDSVKDYSIGLEDIDEAIMFYFENVIRPSVMQDGARINVPVIYGSPERWKSIQYDGYYRDKDGKLMAPLIMFKRDSIEKVRDLGNKLDGNNSRNFQVFEKKYSQKNNYDNFSILSNRIPVKELYGVIIPDYVTINYRCIAFTNYVEQMNTLIEAINFASDSFWGDKNRFQFRARIDTFSTQTQVESGGDRIIRTEFDIILHGYIIPNTINKKLAEYGKFYSKARLNFTLETDVSLEELNKIEAKNDVIKIVKKAKQEKKTKTK